MPKFSQTFTVPGENGPMPLMLKGRYAQTLEALIKAGPKGITAHEISSWALRLSHYIFILRTEYGLIIHMAKEPHGGSCPGWHGRYTLETGCQLVPEREAA